MALAAAVFLTGCIENDQVSAVSLLRQDRGDHGVRSIDGDSDVSAQAQQHATEMAMRGSLFHSRLKVGSGECARGENVGYGSSLAEVERALMNSQKHRDNILNSDFDHVGIGVVRWQGQVWLVQLFVDQC